MRHEQYQKNLFSKYEKIGHETEVLMRDIGLDTFAKFANCVRMGTQNCLKTYSSGELLYERPDPKRSMKKRTKKDYLKLGQQMRLSMQDNGIETFLQVKDIVRRVKECQQKQMETICNQPLKKRKRSSVGAAGYKLLSLYDKSIVPKNIWLNKDNKCLPYAAANLIRHFCKRTNYPENGLVDKIIENVDEIRQRGLAHCITIIGNFGFRVEKLKGKYDFARMKKIPNLENAMLLFTMVARHKKYNNLTESCNHVVGLLGNLWIVDSNYAAAIKFNKFHMDKICKDILPNKRVFCKVESGYLIKPNRGQLSQKKKKKM